MLLYLMSASESLSAQSTPALTAVGAEIGDAVRRDIGDLVGAEVGDAVGALVRSTQTPSEHLRPWQQSWSRVHPGVDSRKQQLRNEKRWRREK